MSIDVTHSESSRTVENYQDDLHAEALDELCIGEHGYKYRLIGGVVMPPYITPSRYELSRSIETRSKDICYTSFPKSGSTWLAHILVRIVNNGEVPAGRTLRDCLQWVAASIHYPRSKTELEALPSPRIFASHMPFQMAVGGDPLRNPCKYVYIARNPKDVAVSYYYFERGQGWSGNYDGPWSHWLQMFLDGGVQRGDWFEHVLGWWRRRHASNVYFMKYEDLLNDFQGELRRLNSFLGYAPSDEMMQMIEDRTSFESMKKDRFSNLHEVSELKHFYRKGQVGSWKERFTVHESEWFDEAYRERVGGTGLEFEFE